MAGAVVLADASADNTEEVRRLSSPTKRGSGLGWPQRKG
jgi:hypothetical protein